MNRSYSKIRHIQESNQKLETRLISEQGFMTPVGNPYSSQGQKNIETFSKSVDQNTALTILQIGTAFLPVIGPFISGGIGLYSADLLNKEGKKTEATIVAVLSVLPLIGSIVSKIPGLKELGAKGMEALASKLVTQKTLSGFEQQVVKNIAKESKTINSEKNAILDFLKKKSPNKSSNFQIPSGGFQRIIPKQIKDILTKLTSIKVSKPLTDVFKKHSNDLALSQGSLSRLAAGSGNTVKIEYNSADLAIDRIMNTVKNSSEGKVINFKSLVEDAYQVVDELEEAMEMFPKDRDLIWGIKAGVMRFLDSLKPIMNYTGTIIQST